MKIGTMFLRKIRMNTVLTLTHNKKDMNETLELQIKRLEFCRDCIVLDYDAGREEYNRLERMIEELKQLKSKQK